MCNCEHRCHCHCQGYRPGCIVRALIIFGNIIFWMILLSFIASLIAEM